MISDGRCAGGCFPGGTEIATWDGTVAIEDLEEGDSICVFDASHGLVCERPLAALLRDRTDLLIDLVLANEIISATARQRFWVEETNAWVAAQDLLSGMRLRTVSGDEVDIHGAIPREVSSATTYNLVVAEFGTYFVGEEGVLVQGVAAMGGHGEPPDAR